MMRRHVTLFIVLMTFTLVAQAQRYAVRETFLDADSWFYYQEYEEALSQFLQVYQQDTTHANVAYKIGYCYLNIDGQESRAIPYLEQAARDYTFTYRDNTYSEKRAPADAVFYLGNAYLIDNQIKKAKKTFQAFKRLLEENNSLFLDPENRYNLEFLDKQIHTCDVALELMDNPISYVANNVQAPINTNFSDITPVVSGDGNSMVYVTKLKFYDALFYTRKVDGQWTSPINLMGQLGIDDNAHPTSINYDGTELYLYREERLAGNIYVSHLKDGIWSKAQKLNEGLNTKYWEAHASISPDGQQLYFVSNREGGQGDLDIYIADRLEGDTWGNIRNLGPVINTKWNENTPFLSAKESILFFASEGHKSMGGYDIFYSLKVGDLWTKPKNIGYPLNTTNNNMFYYPMEDATQGYLAQFSSKGFGNKDIYRLEISDLTTPSDVRVEGQLTMDNPEDRNVEDFNIFLIDKHTHDTLLTLTQEELKNIEHFTPSGAPHLVYESFKTKEDKQFFISQPYAIKEVFLETPPLKPVLAEQNDETRPEIHAEQSHYTLERAGQKVEVKLSTKQGKLLLLDTYVNGQFIKRDTFELEREQFVYEYQPIEGENRLLFSLIGDDDQQRTEEVFVSYIPIEQEIASTLDLSDTEYQLNAEGKKVKIRLAVKEGSKLIVETYVGDELIKTEEFDVKGEEFVYEYTPESEDTRIDFRLIEPDNKVREGSIALKQQPITDELAALIKAMQEFSNNRLKVLLPSMQASAYPSSDSLLKTLRRETKRDAMMDQALDASVMALLMQLDMSPVAFLEALKALANDTITKALEEGPQQPETLFAVLDYLYKNQQPYGYNEEDIDALLDAFLVQQFASPDRLHASLQQLAQSNPLAALRSDDERIMGISTVDDLLDYLSDQPLSFETIALYKTMIQGLHLDYLSNKYGYTTKKPEQKQTPTTTSWEKNKWIYMGFAAVGFVLIVLFIILRKRKKRDKKS
ncbi:MAG: hypothetical protein R6U66_11940 [Bacteroidales bacterium]